MGMPAYPDGTAENLHIPGFHEQRPVAEIIELGAQKMLGIPALNEKMEAFDDIRACVSSQAAG